MSATLLGLMLFFSATVPVFGWAVASHRLVRGGLLLAVASAAASAAGVRLIGAPTFLMGVLLGLALFLSAVLAVAGSIVAGARMLSP